MPRFRPGSKPHPLSEEQPDDLTRLWLLRIMQTLGGHKHWIRSHDFREDKLARALGLGHWLEEEANRPFNPKAVRWELRQLHAQAEAHADSVQSAPALRQNLAQLAALANLSEVDCKILEFTCCLHCDSLLEEATDLFENLSIVQVIACVATILALPVDAVRSALAPGAVLARTGLLTLERNGPGAGCAAGSTCCRNNWRR